MGAGLLRELSSSHASEFDFALGLLGKVYWVSEVWVSGRLVIAMRGIS